MIEERRRNEYLEGSIKKAMESSSFDQWLAQYSDSMKEYGIEVDEVLRHAEYRSKRIAGEIQLPFTLEESEKINEFQSKWDRLVFSTDPVDVKKTENTVNAFYRSLDLQEPLKVWSDSTLQAYLLPLALKDINPTSLIEVLHKDDWATGDTLKLLIDQFVELKETCMTMSSDQLKTVSYSFYKKAWQSATKLRENLMSALDFEKFASFKYEYHGSKSRDFLIIKSLLEHTYDVILSCITKSMRERFVTPVTDVKLCLTNTGELSGPAIMYGAAAHCFPSILSEETKPFEYWIKLHELAPAYYFANGICFIMKRPTKLLLNDNRAFHSEQREAVRFVDGFKFYFVNGRMMPRDIMEDPSNITLERIERTENVEVRQILITLYGPEKYIKESGAHIVHQDEFGILYHKDFTDGVCEAMVCVINSTPEPDGTSKGYYLRVPPNIVTTKAAVAWTFGLEEDEYEPDVES